MQESVSKKDIVDQMADLNLNDIGMGPPITKSFGIFMRRCPTSIRRPWISPICKRPRRRPISSGSLKDLETTLSEKIK